jgi:hypothetical protein
VSSRERSDAPDYARNERGRSLDLLRQWLKPGDVVLTCVLHTSRSGRERVVGAWAVNVPERNGLRDLLAAVGEEGPNGVRTLAVKSRRYDECHKAETAHAAGSASPRTIRLFGHVARVLNLRADVDRGGVVTRDGGSNELVHELGRVLYSDGRAFVNEEL